MFAHEKIKGKTHRWLDLASNPVRSRRFGLCFSCSGLATFVVGVDGLHIAAITNESVIKDK